MFRLLPISCGSAHMLFIYLFPVYDSLFGKCRGGSSTAGPDGNRGCTADITRLLLVRVAQLSSSFASPARARQKEKPAPCRETVRRERRETFSRSFNGRGFSEASPAANRRNTRLSLSLSISISISLLRHARHLWEEGWRGGGRNSPGKPKVEPRAMRRGEPSVRMRGIGARSEIIRGCERALRARRTTGSDLT